MLDQVAALNMPHVLTYLTWLGPKVLLMFVIAAIIRQKLWSDFPVFLSFLVFEICRTVLLFYVYRSAYPVYFWTYWTTELLSVAIKFFIIHEIFACALKPYSTLARLTRVLFPWSFLLLLTVAIVIASAAPAHEFSQVIRTILILDRTMSIIQVGLFVFLFLFVKTFAIPWKHYVLGITLGFAFYGLLELASLLTRSYIGPAFNDFVNWSLRLGASISISVWVAYFVLPRKEPVYLQIKAVSPLQEWNEALRQILAGSGVRS